jgi:hypothetical protein
LCGSGPAPGLGDELRAIVGTNVFGHAAQDEQIGEHVDDIDGFQLPVDPNGQTFVRKLVDDVQHPVFLAFMRAILDKVVGPDMVLRRYPRQELFR